MSTGHDILILQAGGELPPLLAENLHQRGYATLIITEFDELDKSIKRLKDPFLLVDCGPLEDVAMAIVKTLIKRTDLHKIPIIVLGKSVDAFENTLSRFFKLSVTVSTPCTSSDIVEAVNYVLNASGRSRETARVSEVKESVAPKAELNRPFKSTVLSQFVFEAVERLEKRETLGGGDYTAKIDQAFLRQRGYMPRDMKVFEIAEEICVDAGKWGKGHLNRMAYVVGALLESIGISEKGREVARSAAFLFAWSFAGENPELLHTNYLRGSFNDLRKELCSRIKDSALKTSVEINPEGGNVIATMARLVGQEGAVTDDESGIIASTLMVADLIDRVCFHSSFWDPRAAHSLLRHFRAGAFVAVHPLVVACAVRFLSETVALNQSSFLIPKHLRDDPTLRAAAKDAREQPIEADEKRVGINALQPGMRLTRPLFAFDGRKILSGNLTLDHDLIWRLWQLSAVRPLNGPLVVEEEN
jgi:hypothetical protein